MRIVWGELDAFLAWGRIISSKKSIKAKMERKN